MSKKDEEREAFARVSHKLKTIGIEVAVDSLISVAADAKAPPPARATAGTSLLRAAGMISTSSKDAARAEKSPAEMSPEELTEALEGLRRDLAGRRAGDEADGVFE
ncbi:hypothetical protein GCM10007881_61340 [Mesorhizobium huakuii]|uniref:hypothetical protein n=1 Tax=Mesorhizobium huakuii TaxID=28104 RepID=UPI00235D030F|nr:hypothetical protein [Mesorhizobium huakuii]GLQ82611.1 hypothetical protein GCM10007881_61340 [Mesorhizobium huakuii]